MAPKSLREVKDQRLAGYELKTGYLLVLKHGLMGTFPALIAEGNELFICTDRQLLEKVWDKIEKRPARIVELQLYANETESVGFNVGVGDDAMPISILSEKRFNVLAKSGEYAFKWAPGLLSLENEVVVSPFS